MTKYSKVGCVIAEQSDKARKAFDEISRKYNVEAVDIHRYHTQTPKPQYDLILSIGGDGTMLRAIHTFMHDDIPIYGVNRGSLGFLLNEYNLEHMWHNIEHASVATIHPLETRITCMNNITHSALAVNEVSLIRQKQQSANLEISIDKNACLRKLVSDGVIVATPTGSSAYNFAAHGPIVPLDANILLMTPISPFRPKRWNGAMIPKKSVVTIKALTPDKRPVSTAADFNEFRDTHTVKIWIREDIEIKLLFDYYSSFDQRVIREQFSH